MYSEMAYLLNQLGEDMTKKMDAKINAIVDTKLSQFMGEIRAQVGTSMKQTLEEMASAATATSQHGAGIPAGEPSATPLQSPASAPMQPKLPADPSLMSALLQYVVGDKTPQPQNLIPIEMQQQLMASILQNALAPKASDVSLKDIIAARNDGMKDVISLLQVLTKPKGAELLKNLGDSAQQQEGQ